MPSSNPVDYGADPCGLRNSAWAINECLSAAGRCDFPVGTFLIGSTPGAKITQRFRFGNVATFTTATPHGLVVGEKITLYGFTDKTFNGTGPNQYGFRVDSILSPTTFTATVPGPNSGLVVEDGWINLIGGGYTSSIVLGYGTVKNNIAFTGQGAGKTRVKFADHTSTKRGDTFGFNIQMLKCLGNYAGVGVVGAPGAYPGNPVDATNCKNLRIEGITFDGNYANNGPRDIQISTVQRVAGINTYTTPYPHLIDSSASPSYAPPVSPLPSNVSKISQYIDGVTTTGGPNDATFNGFGPVINVTSQTFQRDLRALLIASRRNAFNFAIYTKHPSWNFGFTIGDTVNISGFADAAFNGSFVVIGFLSTEEFYVANAGVASGVQINGFERALNVATYDTAGAHGYVGGEAVWISNLSDPSFNGYRIVSGIPAPNQFTVANVGTNVASTPDLGYSRPYSNAHAWAAPDVLPTAQPNAGVNSSYTVAGLNLVGENTLVQDCEFYDYGVGIADAETFVLKSFLPSTVDSLTKGTTVRRNRFGYQGRNSVQATLYPGSSEANTQCTIGGYSSLVDPINTVSRSAGVATYTCVMKHNIRVGDVVSVSIPTNYVFGIITAKRQSNVVTFTTSAPHFLTPGNNVGIDISDDTFDGTFVVASVINSTSFTVAQVDVDVFPAISVTGYGAVNLNFSGTATVISTPDSYRFTASNAGIDVLPGVYLDGTVIMQRSTRIFAKECVFENNRIEGGPNPINQQCPVHGFTPRETNGCEVRYNNFDGFTGTCMYVDSYHHYGTHVHHNSGQNVSAFIALNVQDWYSMIVAVGGANPETYSTLISAHKDMLIEYNDVLLTGPASWYYQPAFAPLDAVFVINNHDVNRSDWYYPTDYQIPITTATRAANVITFTTASDHELQPGYVVSAVGVADGTFSGVFTVATVPNSTQFTVADVGPGAATTSGFVGINTPIHFPWEIKMSARARTGGTATYTTTKAHNMSLGYHVTIEGFTDPTFNGQFIVTGMPTTTTFQVANAGPDVATVTEPGNFFRYVENIQIRCNTVRRLSGNELFVNNGGKFGPSFLAGRPDRCVAPLEQTTYLDCPEGCLDLQCDPGPCKPDDYIYRI